MHSVTHPRTVVTSLLLAAVLACAALTATPSAASASPTSPDVPEDAALALEGAEPEAPPDSVVGPRSEAGDERADGPADADPSPETETEAEADAEAQAESATGSETEVGTETDTGTETDAGTEPVAEAETDPGAGPEAETEDSCDEGGPGEADASECPPSPDGEPSDTDTDTGPTPGGDDEDPDGDGGDEPAPEEDAVWDVPNGTVNDAGATVLNDGHVDVASLLDGDGLTTRVKDTAESSDPVWRDPALTVLQLSPDSLATVPTGGLWSFLGTAGSSFYQVTQTAQTGLLWPGWSTESIASDATKGGVDWTLTDFSGPGEFALYETGSFGQPTVLFNTRDGVTDADSFTIPKLTHAHGSWAFGAEGNYCLAFDRSTTLASGDEVSDSFVLAVAVAEADVMGVDPAECFQEPDEEPASDQAPAPDDQLTDAARGGVEVVDGAGGFQPGQLVGLRLPEGHAGERVSGWLRSTPTWLGWATVEAQDSVGFRLPTDAAAGPHRVVVQAADGSVIGWDDLEIVAVQAAAPEGQSGGDTSGGDTSGDGTPPSQEVPATQCVAGATILSAGHIDYATRIVSGELESLIGDDTSGTKVFREPSGTILWLKPSSLVTVPAGYGQVGAAGSRVWQVPQTQNLGLIWLGWNTEALNAGNTLGPVTWTVDQVAGPGSMKVYLSSAFGGVQQMVFDNGGSYQIPQGVHAHANWAFSAEGVYRIGLTQTATLADGRASSDTETLVIVVGDVDPASAAGAGSGCGAVSDASQPSEDTTAAKAADQAAADRAAAGQAAADVAAAAREASPRRVADADGGPADPPAAPAQDDPVPLLLAILGLLLMVGASGAGVLWWRGHRGARA